VQRRVAKGAFHREEHDPLNENRGKERREHDQLVGQRPSVQPQRPAQKTRPRCCEQQSAKQNAVNEGEAEPRARKPRRAVIGVADVMMLRCAHPSPRKERRTQRNHHATDRRKGSRQGIRKRSTPFDELKLRDGEVAAQDKGERKND